MSMEVVIAAIALAGLLVIVLVMMYISNEETERLLAASENGIQCGEISGVVARLYNNRGTAEETVYFAEGAIMQRVSPNSGGIVVGGVSCSYIGSVEFVNGSPPPAIVYDTDAGGISLSKGNQCFSKSNGSIVVSRGMCA